MKLLQWSRQRTLDGPTVTKTVWNGCRATTEPKKRRPLRDRAVLSVVRQSAIVASIISLGYDCGPNAVVRRVRPISVLSLQGETTRPGSHISDECLEAVPPRGTHRDASSAVIMKLWVFIREASPLRRSPAVVFSRSLQSMRSAERASELAHQATATPGVATRQLIGGYMGSVAAFTQASPSAVMVLARDQFDDGQSGELSPFEVPRNSHYDDYSPLIARV